MIRLQSNIEKFKLKNSKSPLRDQRTNHVDKLPENQDKKPVPKNVSGTKVLKILSINQKKCNHDIQPNKKLRIFATL
jgi:hypothetical protein